MTALFYIVASVIKCATPIRTVGSLRQQVVIKKGCHLVTLQFPPSRQWQGHGGVPGQGPCESPQRHCQRLPSAAIVAAASQISEPLAGSPRLGQAPRPFRGSCRVRPRWAGPASESARGSAASTQRQRQDLGAEIASLLLVGIALYLRVRFPVRVLALRGRGWLDCQSICRSPRSTSSERLSCL